MEATGANNSQFNSFLQQASNNPVAFLQSLDQLLEDFGPEGVADASTQRFLQRFGDALKEMINDSDLPQPIKDAAIALIDSHLGCNCDAEAAEAVENSEMAETVDCMCDETVEETVEEVEEACSCESSGGSDMSPEAQAEADAEAANEGGSPVAPSPAAQTEAEAEAANEGGSSGGSGGSEGAGGSGGASGSGGAGGGGGMTADDVMPEPEASDTERRRGMNWLEALASTLADIQSKFLDKALAASRIMAEEADNVTPAADSEGSGDAGGGEGGGEGGGSGQQSGRFLQAQASYTANMQMFTIFSNQVSTSIKTLGEGLAGISRKQ